jgi:hypothetical protein
MLILSRHKALTQQLLAGPHHLAHKMEISSLSPGLIAFLQLKLQSLIVIATVSFFFLKVSTTKVRSVQRIIKTEVLLPHKTPTRIEILQKASFQASKPAKKMLYSSLRQ